MPDDDPQAVYFVEPCEGDESFRAGLAALIDATLELGPIIHVCLLSQAIGMITASNLMSMKDGIQKTMNMNFEVGIQQMLGEMMEQSLKQGKPN